MRLKSLENLEAREILKELKEDSTKEHIAQKITTLKLPNKRSEKYRYFDIEEILDRDLELITTKDTNFKVSGKKLIIKDGSIIQAPNIDGVEVKIESFLDIEKNHFDSLYYVSHLLTKKVPKVTISKDSEFEIEHQLAKIALTDVEL